MVVESKYNIDDHVWRMYMNVVNKEKISGVFINVDKYNQSSVEYTVYNSDDRICENNLFSSKEELLKSL